jgi:hypothetical protein
MNKIMKAAAVASILTSTALGQSAPTAPSRTVVVVQTKTPAPAQRLCGSECSDKISKMKDEEYA